MDNRQPITCAEDVARAVQPGFPRAARYQECFVVLSLDAKHRPIGRPSMVAMGSVAAVNVHPRDVYRTAVKRNAIAIVVAHNHPSGDCEPSTEDLRLTERLKAAGALLGIQLLDHVITSSGGRFIALASRGLL